MKESHRVMRHNSDELWYHPMLISIGFFYFVIGCEFLFFLYLQIRVKGNNVFCLNFYVRDVFITDRRRRMSKSKNTRKLDL